VEDALTLSKRMPDAVLVGERRGERLPGFHLGNSPLEVMASPRMDGRPVIFTSSNGAQRLMACSGATHTLVGTLANASMVTQWTRQAVRESGLSVVFIAAGLFPV
jgi:2-phosphosulfolactate phosphatase